MKDKERNIKLVIPIVMFIGFFALLRILTYLQYTKAETIIFSNVSAGLVTLCGLSMLALAHSLGKASDKISAKIFMGMIILVYLGVICDNLSWAFDGTEHVVANYVLNMCAYIIMPIVLVMFWDYQNRVFLDDSEHSKKIRAIVNITAILDILNIIIGAVTGYLFYINEEGKYSEGSGYFIIFVYPIIVVICCVYENLRRKLPLQKKISLLAFGVVPTLAICISIPLPEYSTVYVAFFVDLILVYGTVQVQKEQELFQKNVMLAERDIELSKQETQIMISQMQPHFLYNTLTAIYTLCDTDTALAQKTIRNFSTYLRTNMDSIGTAVPIPFEKELNHTKIYLEIETLRFSDILKVEYDINVTDFLIPALTLQPIVENAVRYGIRSREDGGTVVISTKRVNSVVYLTVQDDGMGFDINEKKEDGRSHLGIENTRKRLQQMMNADLIIDSQIGRGTTVTIIIDNSGKEE